ncbi:MAG: heavy metal translocating P-type ATPase [bacterium]|nr:heavy metal translocating P-type ATPase [bacterium]
MEYNAGVKGMHCASCAMIIEKTLLKEDGVKSCQVNYATEKLKIEFDDSKVNLKDLGKKIEPLGYTLNIKEEAHTMADGTVMSGMDHSEHLGLDQSKQDKLKELESLKKKVIIVIPLIVFSFLVMGWEILATYKFVPEMTFSTSEFVHHILPLFATYTLFVVGAVYLEAVVRFIKYKVANMDTLVGIGTLTAYLYSILVITFETFLQKYINVEHTYFDVTIIVIGFITLGKYLESKSKLKTGEAIEKLLNLQAKTALVERNGERVEIPVEKVLVGELIIVKPGTKIPVDGKVVEGYSSVDESMITGESIPTDKSIGDLVIGGTINKQGMLKFMSTKIGSDTVLSQIVKMVEDAQGSKAPIQKLADKISAIFVPIVLVLSVVTLLVWVIVGSFFLPFSQALSIGLLSFIGILVIACPCALGLATPTAIIVGTGKGAENGILVKNAEGLEKLNKVNTIVTDKTGTLTKGLPEVTDVIKTGDFTEDQILQILASIEENSEHPLALAVTKKATEKKLTLSSITDFSIIEGKGLTAKIDGVKYYAGNLKLIEDLNIDFDISMIDSLTNKGKTPVFLVKEASVIGVIGIADTLKDNAKDTITALHKLNIKVILLTGDNLQTAKYIADQVGIDEVIAEVLPNQKADKIKELQKTGLIVAMVGDGVNDAPALAQSDVGIAMATGTDVAIESAELTLLKGDISKILKAIKLSKFTMSAIKQNLFWAFIYNIIGIPIAAGLLYPFWGVLLNPVFAGLAMSLSSVSVVSNSLRLKYKSL